MQIALNDKINSLNTKCQLLQKNGKHLQCIDILQEVLSIKRQMYGTEHYQFTKASQKLCQELNLASMVYLQKQKYDVSLDLLKKAQLVSLNMKQFRAATLNNLACYYRRTGKLRTALSYLIQALQLQIKLEKPHSLADTHLNLCAVLSQLDKHDQAMQHVLLSIVLIQDQFLSQILPIVQRQSDNNISQQRLAVLAIAYHNLGVQLEHTKRFQQAVKIYNKAYNMTKQNIPSNQRLIKNLQKVIQQAQNQLGNNRAKQLYARRLRIQQGVSDVKLDIYNDLSRDYRIKQSKNRQAHFSAMGQGRRRLLSRKQGRYGQGTQRKKYESFTSKRRIIDSNYNQN